MHLSEGVICPPERTAIDPAVYHHPCISVVSICLLCEFRRCSALPRYARARGKNVVSGWSESDIVPPIPWPHRNQTKFTATDEDMGPQLRQDDPRRPGQRRVNQCYQA